MEEKGTVPPQCEGWQGGSPGAQKQTKSFEKKGSGKHIFVKKKGGPGAFSEGEKTRRHQGTFHEKGEKKKQKQDEPGAGPKRPTGTKKKRKIEKQKQNEEGKKKKGERWSVKDNRKVTTTRTGGETIWTFRS